ncbi:MAG TPA: hypothetical protein VF552_16170 [Allosphingosinicella sp.]|jgi:hypothetical protein
MRAEFGTRELLLRTLGLLRAAAPRAAVTIVVLSAAGAAIDSNVLGEDGGDALSLILTIGTVGFQFWLTRAALGDIGSAGRDSGRFGAFFLLGIVSTIAILAGFVLLVLPGILLLVRWWPAGAILLGDDATLFGSLKESWRETDGHFWTIFPLLLMLWVPAVLAAGAMFAAYGDGAAHPASFVPLNLAMYGATVAGWHLAVAAYSFMDGRSGSLDEIFS